MSELRKRREGLGVTLEAVSEATRIPVQHIVALEEGRLKDLPAGPYADAYQRTYIAWLDKRGDAPRRPDGSTPPPPIARRDGGIYDVAAPTRRMSSGATLVTAAVLVTVVVGVSLIALQNLQVPAEEALAAPDQQVTVTARRTTSLVVKVDDGAETKRTLAGGEAWAIAAETSVEIDVPAVQDVKVEYNGDVLVPLGPQDRPRKLLFFDDVEAR